jgi:hypothetical protein
MIPTEAKANDVTACEEERELLTGRSTKIRKLDLRQELAQESDCTFVHCTPANAHSETIMILTKT